MMTLKETLMNNLKNLANSFDSEVVLSLYDEYKKSSLNKIQLIENLLSNYQCENFYENLYETAHALKGIADITGHSEMSIHAMQLSQFAIDQNLSGCVLEKMMLNNIANEL